MGPSRSSILHKIKRKESVRRKLKTSPTTYLREKCKALQSEVKQLLRDSHERFLEDLEKGAKDKPKRLWTVLRHKDESRSVPTQMSMTDLGTSASPSGVTNLFNRYFASVFNESSTPQQRTCTSDLPILTDLSLTVEEVKDCLCSLDCSKATGTDGIPAKLLKEATDVIAPSLCLLFN